MDAFIQCVRVVMALPWAG